MESTLSEIQVDSKSEKRPAGASPQKERPEGATSRLCFNRRKKAAKAPKPKAGSEAAELPRKRPPEAGASDQPQRPVGAWASIKRLVTHRKRSDSSKAQKSFEAEVRPNVTAKDMDLSKKKTKFRLRIPCIRFSRRAKRGHHAKVTDDSDSNIQVQAEAEGLEIQTQTQSDDQAIKAKSTPKLCEGVSQKDGKEVCEPRGSSSVTSGENVISVELGLENKRSALQTGVVVLERETEEIEKKTSVQPQPASRLQSPGTDKQHPVASDVPPSPAILGPLSVEECSTDVQESGADWKDTKSKSAAEEDAPQEIQPNPTEDTEFNQSKDIELNQAEDIELNQTEDIELNQTEDTGLKQTEDIELNQAEKIKLNQAEEIELNQAEIELDQAEDIELNQTKDTELNQTEDFELNQVEEIELNQAEEIKLNQADETVLSQASDLKENGVDAEKPKSEESKRMEPIAIIITDTEISEFDVKKSKNVPKQFLISMANDQVGVFANDSDFEGRTSEQYETLLIETASSLVKNAIQLSIEQLVNETVSETNEMNTVLQ